MYVVPALFTALIAASSKSYHSATIFGLAERQARTISNAVFFKVDSVELAMLPKAPTAPWKPQLCTSFPLTVNRFLGPAFTMS